uniref:Reverse transcriptase domain-containing protein n=1 Tax=Tanacetum cinerariifolium TaxID=118510 RepID=A0A6L2K0M0_TANCI|nr:reverse transcriptase domain-containing protein [Tanacetum cinerariifolium]
MKVLQINQQVKEITHNYETCGGPHSYNDCPATVRQTQNVYAVGAYNQGGNSYQPQGNRNLLSYGLDNYLGPPGFNQNQNRNNQNQNYQNQNRNQGNNHGIPQGNNQGRNQFFQGASHGQNPPPAYPALAIKTQMNSASSSGSGTLPSNIITNLKEDLRVSPLEVEMYTKDPRFLLPLLLLKRSFLKTGRALIDVYEGELTLRVGKEAVTFNLNQTSRYSANYDAMSVNRIDLIDVAYSDFFLEETDAFLAIDDEPILPEIDESYYDSEGDIILLEEFLNDDPSSPPLPPQDLNVFEPTNEKSSIDEPPVVDLKDLPPHLEYAFLEGNDKLPVIITKDLKDKEITALIKVLKSHKQALTWQLSDIKGIDPEFYTHKIVMEDDCGSAPKKG